MNNLYLASRQNWR